MIIYLTYKNIYLVDVPNLSKTHIFFYVNYIVPIQPKHFNIHENSEKKCHDTVINYNVIMQICNIVYVIFTIAFNF